MASLMQVFNVSASGMSAQSVRLNTIASNLSNAESAGTTPAETYHAREPIFKVGKPDPFGSAFNDALQQSSLGVEVPKIVESNEPLRREYQPGNPKANEEGYVYYPNVNVVNEMADMISTSRSYEAETEVMSVAKKLALDTLHIGGNT